jgi:hypothetical protein
MVPESRSKQTLDRPTARLHASRMRFHAAALCGLLASPVPLAAQAAPWADLWRVANGTLAEPAAVATSPTSAFWTPAAVVGPSGPRFAVDAYQTPEVVNVAGLLIGATYGFADRAGVGLVAGRVSVGDLIRTSTSPVSEEGSIPVYAQFVGAAAAGRIGPFRAGASLLLHDARLDQREEGTVTVDAGVRVTPIAGLALGATTHLGNAVITDGPATEYLLGAAYAFGIPPVLGMEAALQARYGITIRQVGSAEQLGTLGLLLARRLMIDAGVIWAGGYGTAAWQPLLGLAFQAGPYRVGIARGSGASGIGGAYRLTLGIGDGL